MWFDAKVALKKIRAARIGTPQNQDFGHNSDTISRNSGISSTEPSNCKNATLQENERRHLYHAVKSAFDDYYSLDKFSSDAWR